jgi:hypothetical protein
MADRPTTSAPIGEGGVRTDRGAATGTSRWQKVVGIIGLVLVLFVVVYVLLQVIGVVGGPGGHVPGPPPGGH